MKHLTRRATRILSEFAPREARRLGHAPVRHEHVMLGMISTGGSSILHELVVGSILSRFRVDIGKLSRDLQNYLAQETPDTTPKSGHDIRSLKERAFAEARQLKEVVAGTEHILLAILRDKTCKIATCLAEYGLTYEVLQKELGQRSTLDNLRIRNNYGHNEVYNFHQGSKIIYVRPKKAGV